MAQALRDARLLLEDTWYVVGAFDCSGTVPEGCVVLATASGWSREECEVLLYRHPGRRTTDILKVGACEVLLYRHPDRRITDMSWMVWRTAFSCLRQSSN